MTAAPETYPVTAAFRGWRLDRFLQQMLPRMSRASIQDAIATRVKLGSGLDAKPARRLTPGDVVAVHARVTESIPAPQPHIALLAEGEGWIVVDKPAGISTTPSARRPGEDAATRLGLAPAHRLDRFTSGCLLLTRDAGTARSFDLLFRAHRITKQYLAVIVGSPQRDRFEIDAPIGDAVASRVPSKVAVRADGAAAITGIEVLARGTSHSLVRAVPRTGRRHQLRVHLAHVGHAIHGDLLYGGDEREFVHFLMGQPTSGPQDLTPGRHLLHAHRLTFPDPRTGSHVEVTAPLPADFAEFAACVR